MCFWTSAVVRSEHTQSFTDQQPKSGFLLNNNSFSFCGAVQYFAFLQYLTLVACHSHYMDEHEQDPFWVNNPLNSILFSLCSSCSILFCIIQVCFIQFFFCSGVWFKGTVYPDYNPAFGCVTRKQWSCWYAPLCIRCPARQSSDARLWSEVKYRPEHCTRSVRFLRDQLNVVL